jgi:hypothetical protein
VVGVVWVASGLLGACAQRVSLQFVDLPAGADADITITGDGPPLPRAMVEVRNVGDAPADLRISESEYWGSTPVSVLVTPPLPIPPGEACRTHIEGGALLRLHNQGSEAARLQVFTPAWTSLTLVVYPEGRERAARVVIVDEPGADGVRREPPVRPGWKAR